MMRPRLAAVVAAEARMACSGEIRAARRLGATAAMVVTTRPVKHAMSSEDARSSAGPAGNVTPNPSSTPRSAFAASTPSPVPIAEPNTPTSSASPSSSPNTCRGVAPAARSSASSRVRWVITIVNVFAIR
jgi:hypothetical protein